MRQSLFGLTTALLVAGAAQAAIVPYSIPAAFDSDLPDQRQVLDFDSVPGGFVIGDGDSLGGIQFHYDFGGVLVTVSDAFDTLSPPNFLGTDDADVFQDGDALDLSFSASNGIGLYVISADTLGDGAVTLSAGGGSAPLVAADLVTTLPDGSLVHFLGLIDAANTFTDASITTSPGTGTFLWNLDDILTNDPVSVPLPPSTWLMGLAAAALLVIRRRHAPETRRRG